MATIPPRVLSIAGSDSGGGAGIQADLKTMCALGCYGMTAITSVTCQNTQGVYGVQDLPPVFVAEQITRVLDDIGADAVKIGMLSTAPIIHAVADALAKFPDIPVVLDPVMVAKSGDALLRADAQGALRERLIPRAALVTPNIPEAEALTGISIAGEASARQAAHILLQSGADGVLIKGGHLSGPRVLDRLFTSDGEELAFESERIDTANTHGTGCTLSSAIACHLAWGKEMKEAVRLATEYVHGAIQHALPLGKGHGPLDHGWRNGRGERI